MRVVYDETLDNKYVTQSMATPKNLLRISILNTKAPFTDLSNAMRLEHRILHTDMNRQNTFTALAMACGALA